MGRANSRGCPQRCCTLLITNAGYDVGWSSGLQAVLRAAVPRTSCEIRSCSPNLLRDSKLFTTLLRGSEPNTAATCPPLAAPLRAAPPNHRFSLGGRGRPGKPWKQPRRAPRAACGRSGTPSTRNPVCLARTAHAVLTSAAVATGMTRGFTLFAQRVAQVTPLAPTARLPTSGGSTDLAIRAFTAELPGARFASALGDWVGRGDGEGNDSKLWLAGVCRCPPWPSMLPLTRNASGPSRNLRIDRTLRR
jgi:hypothetical protein